MKDPNTTKLDLKMYEIRYHIVVRSIGGEEKCEQIGTAFASPSRAFEATSRICATTRRICKKLWTSVGNFMLD